MNGILGFAELLKEPGLTGELQQEYISIIQRSGARMMNIISDIMSISKIESGHMGISISEMNINDLQEEAFSFFKPEAEKKGLQITLKSTMHSGETIVKTDRDKPWDVKDTGIGIDPEKIEMIFERFRQGSESLNKKYEGAGLGLSISKAFVNMLGGKIWIENNAEPGVNGSSHETKGITAFFTIPFYT